MVKSYLANKLIPIPGSTVTMRNFYDEQKWISSDSKMSIPGRKNNLNETCYKVDIRAFHLLQIPVTNDLYDFVMGEKIVFSNNDFPVVNISWNDAINFCNALSKAIGLSPCYIIDVDTEQI